MISIQLPDGSKREYPQPVTVADVAASIGAGLAKAALGGRVGQPGHTRLVDTSFLIEGDESLAIVTEKDPDGLDLIPHSTAHLLAYAVKSLFPEAQVTIGPVIENGFFYDFAYKRPFTPDDLVAIEKKMGELAKKDERVTRRVLPRDEAVEHFKAMGEAYKAEIIGSIPSDQDVSLYREGDFEDLCRGPHVPSTGKLKHFKLMKVAGAYWRGDHRNEMLQRIYGTAWATKEELAQYLLMLEEAEKRDHRKLGRELDLFHIDDHAPGVVFWHPKGWAIWQGVEQYMRQVYRDNGYQEVKGPQLIDRSLWELTGHWDKYRDKHVHHGEREARLRAQADELPWPHPDLQAGHQELPRPAVALRRIRPVPSQRAQRRPARHHARARLHAGRRPHLLHRGADPLRMPGLHGAAAEGLRRFRFHRHHLQGGDPPGGAHRVGRGCGTRPRRALIESLKASGCDIVISPGDGAFYGPKIEYTLKDALGRQWQCGTMQVDFSMPQRLGAEFVAESGERHAPVMLHRAIVGSLERFIGILLEQHAGALPSWLAPTQVVVASITEGQADYVREVANTLQKQGVRVEADLRNGKDHL